MAGCGYVCPLCEGRGIDESGNPCSYCAEEPAVIETANQWIKAVNEDNSCSD